MFRIVRRSALAGALAMGVAMAAIGFTPASAAASPPYALVKLVFRCTHVGPVTVTVEGPGVAASSRRNTGTSYFRGRPGVYKIKRLANGRIAPRSRSIAIKKFSTRTIRVCSLKW
jgi:multidrug efflux pump subunit AcrA (membrane-fusion protein)